MAGQHAYDLAVDFNRQRNKGHHVGRQLRARHGPHQKLRLCVDVLHDDGLRGSQHPARDAFARPIAPERHFSPGQPVGIPDGRGWAGSAAAARHRSVVSQTFECNVAHKVSQNDSAPVQPQQLRHQVQHFPQDDLGRQAFADQAHDLAHQKQLLRAPLRVGGRWLGDRIGERGHIRTKQKAGH